MATKRPRAGQAHRPRGGDDFTLIEGVEREDSLQLHRAGISTFAQLASLSAEEIAAQLAGSADDNRTRIVAANWTEQAHALAQRTSPPLLVEASPGSLRPAEHPEAPPIEARASPKAEMPMVVITLKLTPNNKVADTIVTYPVPERSAKTVSWPGWDQRRLLHVLGTNAQLEIADEGAEEISGTGAKTKPKPAKPLDTMQEAAEALEAAVAPDSTPSARLLGLSIYALPSGTPRHVMPANAPARLELRLLLSELQTIGIQLERYAVSVSGRLMGGTKRSVLGGSQGQVPTSGDLEITWSTRTPSPGLYRLFVALTLDGRQDEQPYRASFALRDGLLYIF